MRPILLFALSLACMEATVPPCARAVPIPELPPPAIESPAVGFVENTGQLRGPARFYALDSRGAVYFGPHSVRIDHAPQSQDGIGVVVDIEFPATPRLEGHTPLPERVHAFTGSESRWRTGLQAYREVRYVGIAAGADLVYRVDAGRLKYDVVLAPGAKLSDVRLRYRGIQKLEIAGDGALLLHTAAGVLREEPPVMYQDVEGRRVSIPGGYRLCGGNQLGYWAADHDRSRALVVDPGMIWSTFLGGTGADYAYAIATDSSGDIYVTGYTASTDYPTTVGAYQRIKASGSDVVVTKLRSDGVTVLWSTYVGGSGATEYGHGIAVDSAHNVYVAGVTNGTNFPVTAGAFQTVKSGGTYDGFVMKLSPAGDRLLYSTYLGGNGDDYALAMALDGSGEAVVAGMTTSITFPTTPGVVKPTRSGVFPDASDGFVSTLNADGTAMVYSTYVGGEGGTDVAYGVACDPSGVATVVGWTAAPTFPITAGAYDGTFNCCREGFVTRLNTSGTAYLFSTYLGKTVEDTKDIELYGVAVNSMGSTYVVGRTNSSSYPTVGASQSSYGGGTYDAVVSRLASNGGSLLFSTYLGGSGDDEAYAVSVPLGGGPCVTGFTDSGNFPSTAGAYDNTANGGADAFLTRFDSGGARVYSTYLGSSAADYGMGVVVLVNGTVALTGTTTGTNFPVTAGAYDVSQSSPGANDVFVSVIDVGFSSVSGVETTLRPELRVENPHPNPFAARSEIRLSLDRDSPLTVRVFTPDGKLVRTLASGMALQGAHRFVWDGRGDGGRQCATGVYLFQVSAPGYSTTRSALLIK